MKVLRVYETSDGRTPYDEWLGSLADVFQARVSARIDRLMLGNPGNCRPVGGGIHELKIDQGPGFRVYFANDGRRVILLLAGGDKSTQQRDIARAKDYWQDYRRRNDG